MTDVAPVTPPAGPVVPAGPEPTPATPPAPGTPAAPPQPAPGAPAAPESLPLTPEALQAELTRARNDAAAERQRRKAAEDKATELENAQLTEAQRIEKERDDLKQANTTLTADFTKKLVAAEVRAKAAELGIIDPAVAATLVAEKVETDADGNPTNLDTVLAELLVQKPYLQGTPGTPPPAPVASPANPASPPRGNPSGLTKAQLLAMTPQQISVLDQAEVDRVLAGP